jgi:hypothetical protein
VTVRSQPFYTMGPTGDALPFLPALPISVLVAVVATRFVSVSSLSTNWHALNGPFEYSLVAQSERSRSAKQLATAVLVPRHGR